MGQGCSISKASKDRGFMGQRYPSKHKAVVSAHPSPHLGNTLFPPQGASRLTDSLERMGESPEFIVYFAIQGTKSLGQLHSYHQPDGGTLWLAAAPLLSFPDGGLMRLLLSYLYCSWILVLVTE